jgi:type IX secretion system PorP/SprF family membrane protein
MPMYSQYNFNPFVINPAMAGIENGHIVNFGYRSQWVNFPTSPTQRILTYNGQFNKNGLGLMFYNNVAGSLEFTGAMAAYNYNIPLTTASNLSLGISMQMFRFQLRPEESTLTNLDLTDPVVIDALNGTNTLESSFGAYYTHTNGLYAGISTPNLIQTKLGGTDNIETGEGTDAQIFGFVGYLFKTKDLIIDPSLLMRKSSGTPVQLELNGKVWFLDKTLMLGSYYKTGENTLALMMGANLENTFRFSYAYEASFNDLSNYHNGSHTFILGVHINKKTGDETPKEVN